jgi:protein-tyrosine phosphatase
MYWITSKLGTAAKYELPEIEKLENVEVVVGFDIRDGEGNTPLQIKRKVWKISEITSKGKRAVIVCKGGISRSNAIALAYLVWNGMNYDKAYNLIREKVPIVQFNMALLDLVKKIYYKTTKPI